MRVGNFSVSIPEGQERNSGHVELSHGTVYRISIRSHHHVRRDAAVRVDGKEVGAFRLASHGQIILERPADDTGKFTFFSSASEEARRANVCTIDREDRGLVQVMFRPEKRPVAKMGAVRGMSFAPEFCSAEEKTSGGITGLTGRSDQQFRTVDPLDYDPGAEVTVSIRLVCFPYIQQVRELAPVTSNPMPKPVE